MLKVGLTGGIGSGKTSVSDLFEKLGVPVIDTDLIAHELVNNNQKVLQEITDAFGKDILNIDGTLNRKKLAQIVFNVKKNKQQLEKILHPKIKDNVSNRIKKLAGKLHTPEYVIVVVPLLIETDYKKLFDCVLVVAADEKKRVKRVQLRDHRSVNEIHSIINNQINDEERKKEADEIIENNGDSKSLENQVKKIHKKYMCLSAITQ